MGNGGSGYYPGVDPDGAGGLVASGNIVGRNISAITEYFFARNYDGTTVPSHTNLDTPTLIDLVTINHTNPVFSFNHSTKRLSFTEAGIYQAIANGSMDTGSIGSGQVLTTIGASVTNIGISIPAAGALFDAGAYLSVAQSTIFAAANDYITFSLDQSSGGDVILDLLVAVYKIGNL